jgi:hypothetical protein
MDPDMDKGGSSTRQTLVLSASLTYDYPAPSSTNGSVSRSAFGSVLTRAVQPGVPELVLAFQFHRQSRSILDQQHRYGRWLPLGRWWHHGA